MSDVKVVGAFVLLTLVSPLACVGSPPKGVTIQKAFSMDDPKLKPFRAMYTVPRANLGLPPLPKQASIAIDYFTDSAAKDAGCDATLIIWSHPLMSISFKRIKNKYQYNQESDFWIGPHQYKLPNGQLAHETIDLAYYADPHDFNPGWSDTNPRFRVPPGKPFVIRYSGKDPRLAGKSDLTPKDIQPVVKEWATT